MKDLLTMFARSPVAAIEKHAALCLACAEALVCVIEAPDAAALGGALDRLRQAEAEADRLRQGMRQQVTRRIFLPVSRAELRTLVELQQSVATAARRAGRHFALFFEADFRDLAVHLETLLQANIAVTRQLAASINELDELFETGFRGAELELIGRMIDELDRLERHADDALWAARSALRAVQEELAPVDAAIAFALLDSIAAVGAQADAAGRQLELLVNS